MPISYTPLAPGQSYIPQRLFDTLPSAAETIANALQLREQNRQKREGIAQEQQRINQGAKQLEQNAQAQQLEREKFNFYREFSTANAPNEARAVMGLGAKPSSPEDQLKELQLASGKLNMVHDIATTFTRPDGKPYSINELMKSGVTYGQFPKDAVPTNEFNTKYLQPTLSAFGGDVNAARPVAVAAYKAGLDEQQTKNAMYKAQASQARATAGSENAQARLYGTQADLAQAKTDAAKKAIAAGKNPFGKEGKPTNVFAYTEFGTKLGFAADGIAEGFTGATILGVKSSSISALMKKVAQASSATDEETVKRELDQALSVAAGDKKGTLKDGQSPISKITMVDLKTGKDIETRAMDPYRTMLDAVIKMRKMYLQGAAAHMQAAVENPNSLYSGAQAPFMGNSSGTPPPDENMGPNTPMSGPFDSLLKGLMDQDMSLGEALGAPDGIEDE